MPALPFEPKENVPAAEMTITKMEAVPGEQASETYALRAQANHVLGAGGETRAFGKLNLDPRGDPLNVAMSVAAASSPLFHRDQEMNVDHMLGGDRNLLTRAVASSQLDQHLGLNILAEEKFGRNGAGRLMGVSVQVDGAGVNSKYAVEQDGEEVEMQGFLGLTAADTGHAPSAVLQADHGIPEHLKGYASPAIQKGLSDLEVMDYITGQIDRHPGNVFIDPENGQVKGIDNDLAFPERDRAEVLASDNALRQKMVPTIPMAIHQDTAAKITAVDPEGMRRMLQNVARPDHAPALSQAEINGAVNRLQELQAAIAHPEQVPGFQVVAQFDDQTFMQAVNHQKAAFNNQQDDKARRNGQPVGQKTFETMEGGDLGDAFRSSYLGSVVMAERQKTFAIAQDPATNSIRPANTVGTAARNTEYVEFARMMEATQQTLKANPQLIQNGATRQQVVDLKQQIAEARTKVAHYDKEMAGLEQGKLGSRLRSLASGGTEGRKEFYADKRAGAAQQLATLERQLNHTIANAVPDNLRAELHTDATRLVQARVEQNLPFLNQPAPQPPAPLPAFVNQPAPQPPAPLPAFVNQPAPQPPAALPAFVNQPAPQPPAPLPAFVNQPAPQPPAALPAFVNQPAPQPPTPAINGGGLQAVGAQDLAALDAIDANEVEAKQEGAATKPTVADMLQRGKSNPELGGLRQGQEGPKPAANSLRASGGWQPAVKPAGPAPKPGALSHP